MGGEKVVVIIDATKDLNCKAIVQALKGLYLLPGDELTLVGVLHQLNTSTVYKTKPNSSLTKARIVEEDYARKKDLLYQTLELLNDSTMAKLDFELKAGSSRKVVAVEAAKRLKATWIILDRVMNKDKKYFMTNLSCKISKLRSNNTIKQLRQPLEIMDLELPPNKSPISNGQVSYDEMIPGDSWEEIHQSPKRTPETTLANKVDINTSVGPSNSSVKLEHTQPIVEHVQQSTLIESNDITIADYDKRSSYKTPICTDKGGDRDKLLDLTCKHDHKKKELPENSICSICQNTRPKIKWHRDFQYDELYEATSGFSDGNLLGEGGFGYVYRGALKNGQKIAVKQHKDASLQGEKEFKSEVEVLSRARHQNLVMLLGSCSEGSHRLLVYEYICNGSLDHHLSEAAKVTLPWEQRIKIALGVAKGLEYLHSHNIIHRDMRPNNILITHDHESLLGDFGLAKIQHDGSSGNTVVGTLGYMAPEYAETGNVSIKTDIYSFGIVMLQLISGRSTTDKIPGGKSLIQWAKPLLKERNYPDLLDKRIIDSHDFLQLFWMVQLTEKCLRNDPSKRPTMVKVVNILTHIKDGHAAFMRDINLISESTNSILDSF